MFQQLYSKYLTYTCMLFDAYLCHCVVTDCLLLYVCVLCMTVHVRGYGRSVSVYVILGTIQSKHISLFTPHVSPHRNT